LTLNFKKQVLLYTLVFLPAAATAATAAPGETTVLDNQTSVNGTNASEVVSSQLPSNINLTVSSGNLTATPSYDLYPDNYTGEVELDNGYTQTYTAEIPEKFNWTLTPNQLNGSISVGSSGSINTTQIQLQSNVDPRFSGEITGNISQYFSVDRFQFKEAGKYTVLLGYGVNEDSIELSFDQFDIDAIAVDALERQHSRLASAATAIRVGLEGHRSAGRVGVGSTCDGADLVTRPAREIGYVLAERPGRIERLGARLRPRARIALAVLEADVGGRRAPSVVTASAESPPPPDDDPLNRSAKLRSKSNRLRSSVRNSSSEGEYVQTSIRSCPLEPPPGTNRTRRSQPFPPFE